MKTLRYILPVLLVAAAAAGMTGCSHAERSENKDAHSTGGAGTVQYTCPMHPEVVQDTAGNCPKCGMKLVEKH